MAKKKIVYYSAPKKKNSESTVRFVWPKREPSVSTAIVTVRALTNDKKFFGRKMIKFFAWPELTNDKLNALFGFTWPTIFPPT